mgnify:CR=1 FL=1
MSVTSDIEKHLLHIETDYTEFYTYLDEEPIAWKSTQTNSISDDDLKNYLESLKRKLARYKEGKK